MSIAVALVAALPAVMPLSAWATTPDPVAASFAAAPVGFATGTRGGAGRATVVVTSLGDSGTGSLRSALRAGGQVRFAAGLTGSINATTVLEVPSATTLDGRGANITIRGQGLRITRATDVVVRNLKFRAVRDDAIAIKFSRLVWLDHLDMADATTDVPTDGFVDATQGSTDITISWSRFRDHRKVMLLGWQEIEGSPGPVRMTLHHNVFSNVHRRTPQARHGTFEITNNLFTAWGRPDSAAPTSRPFAVGAFCGAEVLVRGNVFEPGTDPHGLYLSDELGCDARHAPRARQVGNVANGAVLAEREPATVANPPAATGVPVAPAGDDLRSLVSALAGWQGTTTLATTSTSTTTTSTTTTSTTTTTTSTTTTTTTTTTTPGPTTSSTTPSTFGPTTTWPSTTTVPVSTGPTLTADGPQAVVLAWVPVPGATRYLWQLRTCAFVVVASSDTAATDKRTAGLGHGCYVGRFRASFAGVLGPWGNSNTVML